MKQVLSFIICIVIVASLCLSVNAEENAAIWLEARIVSNGERDGDETISYLYTVDEEPILGLFTDESQYSLSNTFPICRTIHKTR